jgi:hypothetical protein
MSQPQMPVLPQPSPSRHDPLRHERRRRVRSPFVERIAGWSARHRKTAVFGWLALVAVVFIGGHALGAATPPRPSGPCTGWAWWPRPWRAC